MKYNFMITEYLRRSVRVEADSAEEAYEKVEGLLVSEDIVLTADDFADRDIETASDYEDRLGYSGGKDFTHDEDYDVDDDFTEEESR